MNITDWVEAYSKKFEPKVFILTSKVKDIVVADIGLEGFKDEVRAGGFSLIQVIDNITGPVKEEILL